MTVKGYDLPISEEQLLEYVKNGVLTPVDKNGLRVFPVNMNHFYQLYNELRGDIAELEYAILQSKKTNQEFEIEIRRSLELDGKAPEDYVAVINNFLEKTLPRKRKKFEQDIKKLTPKVKKLEKELHPAMVWNGIDSLPPGLWEQNIKQLIDSYYDREQIELLKLKAPVEETNPLFISDSQLRGQELIGKKAIMNYIHIGTKSVKTFKRFENDGLPVHRRPGKKGRGRLYAFTNEIALWQRRK